MSLALVCSCLAVRPLLPEDGATTALLPAQEQNGSHSHTRLRRKVVGYVPTRDTLQRRNTLRQALMCSDDERFFDSKGKRCSAWAQFGCDDGVTNLTLRRVACGYTDHSEIGRIREACPLSCNLCNAISAGGDPVLKYNGRMIKMDLVPHKLTLLLAWTSNTTGESLSILGSTLAHPVLTDDQWFNHIELRVNKVRVLRVALVQPGADMDVRLDGKAVPFPEPCKQGQPCLQGVGLDDHKLLLKEFASSAGHLTFTLSEMKHRIIGTRKAKKVLALFGAAPAQSTTSSGKSFAPIPGCSFFAGDLGIEIVGAKAAKFESTDNQTAYAHLNLKVLGQLPDEARGTFAELVKKAKVKKLRGGRRNRKRLAALSRLPGSKNFWSRLPTSTDGRVSGLVRKARINRTPLNISLGQLAAQVNQSEMVGGFDQGIFDEFCPHNPDDNSGERKKYVEEEPFAEAALRAAVLDAGSDVDDAEDSDSDSETASAHEQKAVSSNPGVADSYAKVAAAAEARRQARPRSAKADPEAESDLASVKAAADVYSLEAQKAEMEARAAAKARADEAAAAAMQAELTARAAAKSAEDAATIAAASEKIKIAAQANNIIPDQGLAPMIAQATEPANVANEKPSNFAETLKKQGRTPKDRPDMRLVRGGKRMAKAAAAAAEAEAAGKQSKRKHRKNVQARKAAALPPEKTDEGVRTRKAKKLPASTTETPDEPAPSRSLASALSLAAFEKTDARHLVQAMVAHAPSSHGKDGKSASQPKQHAAVGHTKGKGRAQKEHAKSGADTKKHPKTAASASSKPDHKRADAKHADLKKAAQLEKAATDMENKADQKKADFMEQKADEMLRRADEMLADRMEMKAVHLENKAKARLQKTDPRLEAKRTAHKSSKAKTSFATKKAELSSRHAKGHSKAAAAAEARRRARAHSKTMDADAKGNVSVVQARLNAVATKEDIVSKAVEAANEVRKHSFDDLLLNETMPSSHRSAASLGDENDVKTKNSAVDSLEKPPPAQKQGTNSSKVSAIAAIEEALAEVRNQSHAPPDPLLSKNLSHEDFDQRFAERTVMRTQRRLAASENATDTALAPATNTSDILPVPIGVNFAPLQTDYLQSAFNSTAGAVASVAPGGSQSALPPGVSATPAADATAASPSNLAPADPAASAPTSTAPSTALGTVTGQGVAVPNAGEVVAPVVGANTSPVPGAAAASLPGLVGASTQGATKVAPASAAPGAPIIPSPVHTPVAPFAAPVGAPAAVSPMGKSGCVSIMPTATDLWCSATCALGSCPPLMCRCGGANDSPQQLTATQQNRFDLGMSQNQGQNQGQVPGQNQGQAPGQNQGQAPGQNQGQAPGQNQGQVPGHAGNQLMNHAFPGAGQGNMFTGQLGQTPPGFGQAPMNMGPPPGQMPIGQALAPSSTVQAPVGQGQFPAPSVQGQAPFGQGPLGQVPFGQNHMGQGLSPFGQVPQGQAPQALRGNGMWWAGHKGQMAGEGDPQQPYPPPHNANNFGQPVNKWANGRAQHGNNRAEAYGWSGVRESTDAMRAVNSAVPTNAPTAADAVAAAELKAQDDAKDAAMARATLGETLGSDAKQTFAAREMTTDTEPKAAAMKAEEEGTNDGTSKHHPPPRHSAPRHSASGGDTSGKTTESASDGVRQVSKAKHEVTDIVPPAKTESEFEVPSADLHARSTVRDTVHRIVKDLTPLAEAPSLEAKHSSSFEAKHSSSSSDSKHSPSSDAKHSSSETKHSSSSEVKHSSSSSEPKHSSSSEPKHSSSSEPKHSSSYEAKHSSSSEAKHSSSSEPQHSSSSEAKHPSSSSEAKHSSSSEAKHSYSSEAKHSSSSDAKHSTELSRASSEHSSSSEPKHSSASESKHSSSSQSKLPSSESKHSSSMSHSSLSESKHSSDSKHSTSAPKSSESKHESSFDSKHHEPLKKHTSTTHDVVHSLAHAGKEMSERAEKAVTLTDFTKKAEAAQAAEAAAAKKAERIEYARDLGKAVTLADFISHPSPAFGNHEKESLTQAFWRHQAARAAAAHAPSATSLLEKGHTLYSPYGKMGAGTMAPSLAKVVLQQADRSARKAEREFLSMTTDEQEALSAADSPHSLRTALAAPDTLGRAPPPGSGARNCVTVVPTATDEWCNNNCALGRCPPTFCKCDDDEDNPEVSVGAPPVQVKIAAASDPDEDVAVAPESLDPDSAPAQEELDIPRGLPQSIPRGIPPPAKAPATRTTTPSPMKSKSPPPLKASASASASAKKAQAAAKGAASAKSPSKASTPASASHNSRSMPHPASHSASKSTTGSMPSMDVDEDHHSSLSETLARQTGSPIDRQSGSLVADVTKQETLTQAFWRYQAAKAESNKPAAATRQHDGDTRTTVLKAAPGARGIPDNFPTVSIVSSEREALSDEDGMDQASAAKRSWKDVIMREKAEAKAAKEAAREAVKQEKQARVIAKTPATAKTPARSSVPAKTASAQGKVTHSTQRMPLASPLTSQKMPRPDSRSYEHAEDPSEEEVQSWLKEKLRVAVGAEEVDAQVAAKDAQSAKKAALDAKAAADAAKAAARKAAADEEAAEAAKADAEAQAVADEFDADTSAPDSTRDVLVAREQQARATAAQAAADAAQATADALEQEAQDSDPKAVAAVKAADALADHAQAEAEQAATDAQEAADAKAADEERMTVSGYAKAAADAKAQAMARAAATARAEAEARVVSAETQALPDVTTCVSLVPTATDDWCAASCGAHLCPANVCKCSVAR
jgi:hypothetical protein